MGMRVDIVTLFPEMCQQVLDASIIGRAARRGCIETHCHQIRDYTLNKQKQTDDYPYGGGCGMVLYAQPIARFCTCKPTYGAYAAGKCFINGSELCAGIYPELVGFFIPCFAAVCARKN